MAEKTTVETKKAEEVKEVAAKTNEQAGDGTTTATVLAQAIINVGLKNVTAGANPMDLIEYKRCKCFSINILSNNEE